MNCKRCQPVTLPAEARSIVTPLILPEWQMALSSHNDKDFVQYILQGIRDGFRIGYYHQLSPVAPI